MSPSHYIFLEYQAVLVSQLHRGHHQKLKQLFLFQKVVIIYPTQPDKSMYRIHLDCIFSPFGCKQCVIWNELTHKNSIHKRIAIEYVLQDNGI